MTQWGDLLQLPEVRLPWGRPCRRAQFAACLVGAQRAACKRGGGPLRSGPDRAERGRSSGVEHNLAKVGVEGSNPFARSKFQPFEPRTRLRSRRRVPYATRPDCEQSRRARPCRPPAPGILAELMDQAQDHPKWVEESKYADDDQQIDGGAQNNRRCDAPDAVELLQHGFLRQPASRDAGRGA